MTTTHDVQKTSAESPAPSAPTATAAGSAASVRAATRGASFADGERAMSPRSEAAHPKSDRPGLIGAKGANGSAAITPGGKGGGAGPQAGPKNAAGLITSVKPAADRPRFFINGGKTGADTIYWSGGTGGRGEQFVSSIDVVLPNFEKTTEAGQGKAWITPGTGSLRVTRSFKGVPAGDNGQYYITAAAAARVDVHEWLHVRSSERHHQSIIAPLEQRMAAYSGPAQGVGGPTEDAALATLYTRLDWNNALNQWMWADHNDNTPMMAVDQAELAAADFPRHLGPATVAGKAYMDYIAMPGEVLPPQPGGTGATSGT